MALPIQGWQAAELQRLEREVLRRELPWLQCRVFGLQDQWSRFLQKKWMVKTTSENFHNHFRAKTLPRTR